MSVNEKTADQLRDEFYEALRRSEERQKRVIREEMRAEFARREEEARRKSMEEQERLAEESRRELARADGGFFAALDELDAIGGMPVEEIVHPLKLMNRDERREYAGIIQCPDAVVLLEYERRLTRAAVRKFLDERLPGFPRDFPGMVRDRAFYGLVSGEVIDAAAERLAKDNGLFVLRIPANRRVEVLNNEAQPREATARKK